MNPGEFDCWRCGANLKVVPVPYGRRAECPACRAELHVCRMCRHYAPGKARQCMEPMAEEVKDKTRANFCDWFQPVRPATAAMPAGRGELDALFGGADAPAAGDTRQVLEDLFKPPRTG
ncbi:MAG: hypothetical protein PHS77_11235 [Gallionellaceae bacterium]|nr:hypothetical protein [Gallionellaceae bacterium]